jgi:hypothetical protein
MTLQFYEQAGIVGHACNLSTCEADAGGLQV